MPPIHKLLNCWFQALFESIILQELLDLSIICDGSECDSEDVPAVIKSVAWNGDLELFSVLALDLPWWIRRICDLVEICDNTDCLVVLAAEMTYRHGLSSVEVQSADERGGEINLYRLRFVHILRGRAVEDFLRFGGIDILFVDASCHRSFRFARVHIARDGDRTHRRIRANGIIVSVAFRLCATFSPSSGTSFRLSRT